MVAKATLIALRFHKEIIVRNYAVSLWFLTRVVAGIVLS